MARLSVKCVLLCVSVFLLVGCGGREHCIRPYARVNFTLFLNLPADNPDVKGYVLKKDQGLGGVVVVSYAGSYRAFDLAYPEDPLSGCSAMKISEDNMRVISECNGAEFMLFTGQPLSSGGAVSRCGMFEYSVVYDPAFHSLRVTN